MYERDKHTHTHTHPHTHTHTHTEVITIPSAPLNRDAQHKLSVSTNKHVEGIVENCRKWD